MWRRYNLTRSSRPPKSHVFLSIRNSGGCSSWGSLSGPIRQGFEISNIHIDVHSSDAGFVQILKIDSSKTAKDLTENNWVQKQHPFRGVMQDWFHSAIRIKISPKWKHVTMVETWISHQYIRIFMDFCYFLLWPFTCHSPILPFPLYMNNTNNSLTKQFSTFHLEALLSSFFLGGEGRIVLQHGPLLWRNCVEPCDLVLPRNSSILKP